MVTEGVSSINPNYCVTYRNPALRGKVKVPADIAAEMLPAGSNPLDNWYEYEGWEKPVGGNSHTLLLSSKADGSSIPI